MKPEKIINNIIGNKKAKIKEGNYIIFNVGPKNKRKNNNKIFIYKIKHITNYTDALSMLKPDMRKIALKYTKPIHSSSNQWLHITNNNGMETIMPIEDIQDGSLNKVVVCPEELDKIVDKEKEENKKIPVY